LRAASISRCRWSEFAAFVKKRIADNLKLVKAAKIPVQ
jgi:hypothetical protein